VHQPFVHICALEALVDRVAVQGHAASYAERIIG